MANKSLTSCNYGKLDKWGHMGNNVVQIMTVQGMAAKFADNQNNMDIYYINPLLPAPSRRLPRVLPVIIISDSYISANAGRTRRSGRSVIIARSAAVFTGLRQYRTGQGS